MEAGVSISKSLNFTMVTMRDFGNGWLLPLDFKVGVRYKRLKNTFSEKEIA